MLSLTNSADPVRSRNANTQEKLPVENELIYVPVFLTIACMYDIVLYLSIGLRMKWPLLRLAPGSELLSMQLIRE